MHNKNLVELMCQTKNYEAHRRKIATIMTKNSSTLDSKRINSINTYYSNRDRSNRYNFKAKQQAVEKQNDLILKKLIKVNNRKTQSVNSRNVSHNNLINMKKTMQTINNQNQKLAKKLITTTSDLRQQKLCDSYKKHLQRKQRIKKYEFDEQFGLVIPKKVKSLQKLRGIETLKNSESRMKELYGSWKNSEENEEDR